MSEQSQKSIASVLGEMLSNISLLIEAEIQLFAAEMRGNVAGFVRGFVLIGIGTLFVLVALFYFLAGCMFLLTMLGLPSWAAAFVMAGGTAIVGAVLFMTARSKLSGQQFMPTRTIDQARRDAAMIRGNLRDV